MTCLRSFVRYVLELFERNATWFEVAAEKKRHLLNEQRYNEAIPESNMDGGHINGTDE